MYIYDSTSLKAENEVLQAKVVKNAFYAHFSFSENPALYVEKYGIARQATDNNTAHELCMLFN